AWLSASGGPPGTPIRLRDMMLVVLLPYVSGEPIAVLTTLGKLATMLVPALAVEPRKKVGEIPGIVVRETRIADAVLVCDGQAQGLRRALARCDGREIRFVGRIIAKVLPPAITAGSGRALSRQQAFQIVVSET